MAWHVDHATVGGAARAHADRLGNDIARRVVRRVDHLRARILVLTVAGQRDGNHFPARPPAFHHDTGVFHGQPRTDIAVDPFDLGIFHGQPALGHEIEHVVRPVLHGDVLDLRALERDEFHHRAVQGGRVELRRGAAFHVGHLGAFVGDDQRALELAEVFRVDAEVSLQRMRDFHAGRDVNERTAAEGRAVQSAEFVVPGRDHFAEPLAENFRVLLQAFGASDKNDTLLAHRFFDVRVGSFAVELRFHAGEELAFLLGDTETLEGAFHVLRHFVPRALGLLALRKIVADVVEDDVLEILRGPMRRHGFLMEFSQRVLAELADPVRFAFDVANVIDCFLGQAGAGVEFVIDVIAEVAFLAVDFQLGLCVAHGCVLFFFQAPTASASGSLAQS